MKAVFLILILIFLSSTAAAQRGLASGSPSEGYISGADGVRLFYRKAGKGKRTIILLHGGPGSNMKAVFPDLKPLATDFAVLMYDQRGGGRSELVKDSGLLTASHHVRDLEALRMHFGLEKMILAGESWGAGLAALYAAEHPRRIDALLLIGPMPPSKNFYRKRFDQVNESTDFYRRLAEYRRVLPTAPDPVSLCREFFGNYLKPYFFDHTAMSRRRGSSCDAPPDAVRNYIVVTTQRWHR